MLKSLNIRNFAVIDHLEVHFEQGLNLLTGETGSGKSIIVDALSLLLGNRSNASQIRTGERMAFVEGTFEVATLEADQNICKVLAEAGIEREKGEEVVIRREINASGKSRIFINDQVTTVLMLRALQPFLVEIHGQGEQRSLLSVNSHLRLLDSFAGCVSLQRDVAEAYARWNMAGKALQLLEEEFAESRHAGDLLQYQLAEIQSIAPRAGEDEELLAEKNLLTHAEKVLQLGTSAYAELYESDASILSRLATIRRWLEELSEIDRRLKPLTEALAAGIVSLTDVADQLRGYGDDIEFSPARLARIEDRLADLERVKRKYNTDLQGIVEIQNELSERLSRVGDLSERKRLQREALAEARSHYAHKAKRLTACRKKAAPRLAERVMADLSHVAMEQARFIVSIDTARPERDVPSEDEALEQPKETGATNFFSPTGADRVEFLLSANPGEEARPLSRVASGGELSRLMLTLRTIGMGGEREAQAGETVIFDEIDVGIGGRVAEAVGRRLKGLSATRQILCVTHQPQIARFADHHYVVSKFVEKGRTITTVQHLSQEERVNELARMIGGAEDTAQTHEAARWLLETARGEEATTGRWPQSRAKRSQKVFNS